MNDSTCEIPVKGGRGCEDALALVDAADYEKVSRYRWRMHTGGYAIAGKRNIFLHRLIMDAPAHLQVDHINRNKLDNRRCNLRLVTRAENSQNQAPIRSTATGYRGVYFDKQKQRFRAQVILNGRKVCHSLHRTAEEAAEAALRARLACMGYSGDVEGGSDAA